MRRYRGLNEDRLVPAVFNVNSLADILTPPSGAVTLRSAIEQANQTPGGNTINLTVPGVYKITLARPDEDANATGDFDILAGGNLTIDNASNGTVIIDGGNQDRIFDINPNFDPANPTAPFILYLLHEFRRVNNVSSVYCVATTHSTLHVTAPGRGK